MSSSTPFQRTPVVKKPVKKEQPTPKDQLKKLLVKHKKISQEVDKPPVKTDQPPPPNLN